MNVLDKQILENDTEQVFELWLENGQPRLSVREATERFVEIIATDTQKYIRTVTRQRETAQFIQ